MQLSLHTLFYCLHEIIYHIFQFLCRRLFINNLGGYGILAIPTQPSYLCIFLLHTLRRYGILKANCVGMAGMPYPPMFVIQ